MYSFLMTISEKYLYYYTIIKAKGIHDNDIIAISIANLKKKSVKFIFHFTFCLFFGKLITLKIEV